MGEATGNGDRRMEIEIQASRRRVSLLARESRCGTAMVTPHVGLGCNINRLTTASYLKHERRREEICIA